MTIFRVAAVLLCGINSNTLAANGPDVSSKAPPSQEQRDPEALIREGNELRKQGRNEEALPLFQAAYAAARTPRTAGQLGLSEMSVGYWIEAEAHLTEALECPNHPWVAKNREGLQEMLGNARQKIADVSVTGSPAGAEVRVNGRAVGVLPLANPLRLSEGPVEIQVLAPGHRTERRTLSAQGGGKLQVTVNLESEPTTPASANDKGAPRTLDPSAADLGTHRATPPDLLASERETRPEQLPRWPSIVTASASVIAFGFGAVELYSWRHAQNSFNDHLASGTSQHDCGAQDSMRGGPGCQALYDEAVRSRALALVGTATGAAFAITSMILWPSTRGAPTPEQKISCAPTPAGRGVECQWRF